LGRRGGKFQIFSICAKKKPQIYNQRSPAGKSGHFRPPSQHPPNLTSSGQFFLYSFSVFRLLARANLFQRWAKPEQQEKNSRAGGLRPPVPGGTKKKLKYASFPHGKTGGPKGCYCPLQGAKGGGGGLFFPFGGGTFLKKGSRGGGGGTRLNNFLDNQGTLPFGQKHFFYGRGGTKNPSLAKLQEKKRGGTVTKKAPTRVHRERAFFTGPATGSMFFGPDGGRFHPVGLFWGSSKNCYNPQRGGAKKCAGHLTPQRKGHPAPWGHQPKGGQKKRGRPVLECCLGGNSISPTVKPPRGKKGFPGVSFYSGRLPFF